MKHIIRLLLLLLVWTAGNGTLSAQRNQQRLTREQLAEVQAQHIAQELGMEEATKERFIRTYCQFQQDLWALGPRPQQLTDKLSEEEMERIQQERFTRSQQILNLRQQYYAQYSEFMSQKQIQRMYELERQMMERLSQRSKRNRK